MTYHLQNNIHRSVPSPLPVTPQPLNETPSTEAASPQNYLHNHSRSEISLMLADFITSETIQTGVDDSPPSTHSLSVFTCMTPPKMAPALYMPRLVSFTHCSPSVFVVALVYLRRLLDATVLRLTEFTVHRLVLTATMLAAKFLDDRVFSARHYARVGGIPSTTELTRMEVTFLHFVDYRLHVTHIDYWAMLNKLLTFKWARQLAAPSFVTDTFSHTTPEQSDLPIVAPANRCADCIEPLCNCSQDRTECTSEDRSEDRTWGKVIQNFLFSKDRVTTRDNSEEEVTTEVQTASFSREKCEKQDSTESKYGKPFASIHTMFPILQAYSQTDVCMTPMAAIEDTSAMHKDSPEELQLQTPSEAASPSYWSATRKAMLVAVNYTPPSVGEVKHGTDELAFSPARWDESADGPDGQAEACDPPSVKSVTDVRQTACKSVLVRSTGGLVCSCRRARRRKLSELEGNTHGRRRSRRTDRSVAPFLSARAPRKL